MPTRTITIDLDAYARLKKAKKPTESFSQTIKRVVPEPIDLDAWFQGLADDPISPEAAAAVERQIRNRAKRSRSRGS